MSGYDKPMKSDIASAELQEELANAQPGTFNRFKVNVSKLVYKCTFGKYGEDKKAPCSGIACSEE